MDVVIFSLLDPRPATVTTAMGFYMYAGGGYVERGRDTLHYIGGVPPLPRRETPSPLAKDKERELQVSRRVLAGHFGSGQGTRCPVTRAPLYCVQRCPVVGSPALLCAALPRDGGPSLLCAALPRDGGPALLCAEAACT